MSRSAFGLMLSGMLLSLAGRTLAAEEPERPKKPAATAELVKQLQDPDYSTRYRAAGELENLGREAESAIPALIDAVGDRGGFNTSNSDFVYSMAMRTLRTIGPPAIPALTEAVKSHANTAVRCQAMRILMGMGRDAYPAIPVLQAVQRQDSLRVTAALNLWQIDPKGEMVVPAIAPGTSRPLDTLLRCLRHDDPQIRIAAIRALAEIGPAAREAVLPLARLTADADFDVRWNAVAALGGLKQEARPAVPALLKALNAEDYVRYAAAESLSQIVPHSKDAALALAERLKDTAANVAPTAAKALGEMGPAAEPAVPALIEALKIPTVSQAAAEALGRIGPGAKSAVPALLQGMKDTDGRYFSKPSPFLMIALGGIGPEARAAIPVLLDTFSGKDKEVYSAAASSLVRIGPAAVPALREALKDARPKVRMLAAKTLGGVGRASRPALPALAAALKDESRAVRVEAAFALWRIDRNTDAALPVLVKGLQYEWNTDAAPPVPEKGLQHRQGVKHDETTEVDNPQEISMRACESLQAMGPAAKAALPELVLLLQDRNNAPIWYVLPILRSMGAAAKPAVPTLADMLKGKKNYHRGEIAWTLGKIGTDAEPAVPALIAALDHEKVDSIGALGRIGPAARLAVPALIRLLRDADGSVRATAAFALGQIGAAAEPAVVPLAKLLQDEEPVVRWAAFVALEALGPAAHEAIPALCRLVGDRRSYLPLAAAQSLNDWSQPRPRTIFFSWREEDPKLDMVPAFDAFLGDPFLSVPERAIRILTALGPAARDAVPALLAARNDDRVTVRLAADAALKKIDPAAWDKAQPTPEEMRKLWTALIGDNEVTAYRALWTLIIAPGPTLLWLRERLHPVAPADPERIARLIRELDDEQYAVREKARKELETLDELAEPALRATVNAKPSLEVRRRIEQLLQLLDEKMPAPQRLRDLRALAVLEKIGTAEARELLRSLAKGAAGASLTREAKASLRRMER